MEKIFKLEARKVPKSMYIFNGIIFVLLGASQFYSGIWEPYNIVFGILFISVGLGYIFLAPRILSGQTNLALKVKIDDISFWAKTTFFGSPVIFKWEDIREIEFDSYLIRFKIKKGFEYFRYNSTPEVSIDIKNAVREVANAKDIPIKGG